MAENTQGFPQGPANPQQNAVATREHEIIREWAARHQAEPATGEATASGPATINVNDGGAGIRFNFPGFSRFRPITWDEWFSHFDQCGLTFVYEVEVADRAHQLWNAHGKRDGRDKEDWFEAERQLRQGLERPSARYRFTAS
jgi:hypothetical protein